MLTEDLDDSLRDLASMARAVAVNKIGPLVAAVERSGTFSPEIREILASAGFFGMVVPEAYGGVDSDIRHHGIVLEELGRVYPSACTYLTAHWLATKLIALNATGPTAASWTDSVLTKAASGEWLGAIAATEPEAGSDLGSVTTTAVPDGDVWVINGTKRFITNGGFADFYTVLARTGGPGSRGLSLFLVEASTPGVVAARWEEKMGLHGSATAEMHFDDVRIPRDHIIGEVDRGFTYLMRGFDEGRLGVAAMSLGISQGALDAATRYAAERRQFGKEIASYQGVQFLIADMAIGVHASRSLLYDAMAALVAGRDDASRLAAIAKTYTTDVAMQVTSNAVQVLGGSGYVRDFPVEMLMRDAKIGQIYEGTNQILRMVIARSYFGELAR
ncbi:acyl-CoA dehydrogenase family protein [Dactylosporangium fulvum]|uniref:Acyl-CoA dehydrogenase family protein n=1 Tax=Dactylosporangium fulvum TaxID=53359 RepID=A0ABY5W855_9ACTN|nr:acyl-CoA dehydrogenase family protein [Dactylosporangium fulvum]UWP85545.1 acyl-CoA dehydrogenase family protein [Dactylosporangium fulvum]